ncbi:hypothetical protein LTR17_001971 [Elasticomyces elasticus]|nr:hypothetical protein LTR17_001971 [Elasticomyces elasticus]
MNELHLSGGNVKLPLYEGRPMREDGDVCVRCSYAIDKVVWPDSSPDAEDKQVTVGWLDRLAATKDCNFCQFLVRMFFSSTDLFDSENITRGRRFLCSLLPPTSISQITGVALDWDISVSFFDHHTNTLDQESLAPYRQLDGPRFRLLADSAGALVDDKTGFLEGDRIRSLARRVATQCNASFVRNKYELCLREHGVACDAAKDVMSRHVDGSVAEAATKYPTLLIDVENCCVVDAAGHSRYVALSYCWAAEPYLQLLVSNRFLLGQKGGIDTAQLAPTIGDALSAMKAVGERYLWVDSLCVVQDAYASKMEEIAAMGTIYRNAVLTIVAASPARPGPDMGLPGVNPGSRPVLQDIVTVKNLEFAAAMPDLWTAIYESRWYTRAWTFQEHELSKRELIFTPHQVYFACQRDGFSEDYVENACVHLDDEDDSSRPDQERTCCSYQTPEEFGWVSPESGVNAYEVLVSKYTARQLSFESDGLNAVQGLLSLIRAKTDVPFLCGLPVPHILDRHVLWLSWGPSLRRAPSKWYGQPFPSWSWAGWCGSMRYPLDGDFFDGRMSYTTETLVRDCKALVWRGPSPPMDVQIADGSDLGPEWDEPTLRRCEAALLLFVAPYATVSLGRSAWGTFTFDGKGADISTCHPIFIRNHCAGLVCFDAVNPDFPQVLEVRTKEQAWTPSPDALDPVEVIALSAGSMPWLLYLPLHPDEGHSANHSALDEDGEVLRDHYPFDESKWRSPSDEGQMSADLINIMVVEWVGEVAYRRGVGQIHPDAWNIVCADTSKVITLG